MKVAWKSIALPNEHGGWGMLAEPLLVGLVLAPSAAAACLLIASVAAFMARHPLKLALSDRHRGTRHPRTVAAERVALAYATVALASAAGALALAGPRPFAPLLAVAPLALVQVTFDARLQGRHLAPEICGGVALAALAPALMLAGGWPLAPSLAVGALIALKATTCVLYVRARLRLDRGQQPPLVPTLAAHVAVIPLAAAVWLAGWAPWIAVAASVVLLLRAAHGLSPWRRIVRPQALGFQELGLGIGFAATLAAGFLSLR
jgi:hypothetical protein